MKEAYYMVVGMSIAYGASLLGMCLAWWAYRKRTRAAKED